MIKLRIPLDVIKASRQIERKIGGIGINTLLPSKTLSKRLVK